MSGDIFVCHDVWECYWHLSRGQRPVESESRSVMSNSL